MGCMFCYWDEWYRLCVIFFACSRPFFLLTGTIRGVCLKQWRWWTKLWGCVLGATPQGCQAPARRPLAPVAPAPLEPATMGPTMPALHWRISPAAVILTKRTTGVFDYEVMQNYRYIFDHFIRIFGHFKNLPDYVEMFSQQELIMIYPLKGHQD